MRTEELEELHDYIDEFSHKSGSKNEQRSKSKERRSASGGERASNRGGFANNALRQGSSQERASSGLDLNEVINLKYGDGGFQGPE
jgi:hypothetical protein